MVSYGRTGSKGGCLRRVEVTGSIICDYGRGSSVEGVMGNLVVRDCVRSNTRGVNRNYCNGSVASPYLNFRGDGGLVCGVTSALGWWG